MMFTAHSSRDKVFDSWINLATCENEVLSYVKNQYNLSNISLTIKWKNGLPVYTVSSLSGYTKEVIEVSETEY